MSEESKQPKFKEMSFPSESDSVMYINVNEMKSHYCISKKCAYFDG